MGGAKNFVIEMEHDLAKEPDVKIQLRAAQREVMMLREQLKALETHHNKMFDSWVKIMNPVLMKPS